MILIIFLVILGIVCHISYNMSDKNYFNEYYADIEKTYYRILNLLCNCKNEIQINTIYKWGINTLDRKLKFFFDSKKTGSTMGWKMLSIKESYVNLLTDKKNKLLIDKKNNNEINSIAKNGSSNGTGSDLIYYWDY